jgi:hypothetical protein
LEAQWVKVDGQVEPGHQIASGRSPTSPYPAGSLELQIPYFKELGLDLTPYYRGTLNISIRPYTFTLTHPQFTFHQVKWIEGFPPEDFSFSPCKLTFQGYTYDSWIYYPHPETKTRHFQDPAILEIIAPHISNITYGHKVKLLLNTQEIELNQPIK